MASTKLNRVKVDGKIEFQLEVAYNVASEAKVMQLIKTMLVGFDFTGSVEKTNSADAVTYRETFRNKQYDSALYKHFKLALKNLDSVASVATVAAPTAAPAVGALTINQLKEIANEFLDRYFGLELEIPIKINGRLKRALGRFRHMRSGKLSVDIELAKDLMMYHSRDEIIDTLKHELVHYALYELDQPYVDGHPHFENTLRRLGVSSTGTSKAKGPLHTYKCKGCGKTHGQKRSFDVRNYRSACCKTSFEYLGIQNH